jgi:ligand-binding sensor domain-containing protein
MIFYNNELVASVWLQRALCIVAISTASVSVPVNALNPDRQISQYAHTAWRLQEGFLGSYPSAIAQTTDGYIWVGTQSGIERFDGVRFVPWIPPGGEVLRSAVAFKLLGTSDGSLWIGTIGAGVWRWKDQKLTRYLSEEFSQVNSILEGETGSVWIALWKPRDGSGAVCQVGSGATRCYGESAGLPHRCCNSITKDQAGYFWIIGNDEAIQWRPPSWSQEIYKMPGPILHTANLQTIAVASHNDVWVGAYTPGRGWGLQHLSHGAWGPLKAANWDSSTVGVGSLLLDRHQVLWVGTTYNGLYRVTNGRVDHFSSGDGLSGNYVEDLFEDLEGNIWVTTTKGVDCFKDLAVATVSPREGLSTAEVDTVLASRDGTIWVGGDQGLDAIRGGEITSLKTGKGLAGVQVTSLFEDHNGHLLVGVDSTLSILKNGKLTPIRRPNGGSLGFVVGMAGNAENDIWAEISGSPRELIRITDFHVKQVLPAPQLPAARKVAIDPEGSIWLGLISGDLARYRQGKLDTFHFPHTADSLLNEIRVGRDGSVLGATSSGVIGWREGKQQTLTMQNGIPCDGINTLIRDHRDDFMALHAMRIGSNIGAGTSKVVG